MTALQLDAAEAAIRLTYPRVHAAPDGSSHFEDIAVPMTPVVFVPGIPLVDVATPQPVTELQFARIEAGYTSDWHPAPRRQFVLILSGGLEVTVADGETRSFGPGSVFLVEDTAGTGHQTRAVGSGECVFVTVAVVGEVLRRSD
jgi:quercetin dioxygenase-like cupin family protein